jgi:ABC-type glycerol-3-phosphate transport system substrate-binding protein
MTTRETTMRRLMVMAAAALVVLAACGGDDPGPEGPGGVDTAASRPESPAELSISSPQNGDVVKGDEVELRIDLQGGEVVEPSEREVTATTGHIHVELDGLVVSMKYGLEQTVKVSEPGTHTLRVEFVAADHLPFDPRVFDEIAFTAK